MMKKGSHTGKTRMMDKIYIGDALTVLKTLLNNSVHCCVTSPPYWGLRDYGVEGQLGLEKTPEEYVSKLVEIFREAKRVLRNDGTLWLNLGDSYNGSGGPGSQYDNKSTNSFKGIFKKYDNPNRNLLSLKPKDLIGIPWRVAFALQADGWYLRSDIIWAKPNPMPESVRDRPTRSHEYIFLMSKSAKYYFDQEAVREPLSESYLNDSRHGSTQLNHIPLKDYAGQGKKVQTPTQLHDNMFTKPTASGRNIRSVWTITTKPFKEAHFSTFPPELPEICIKAGTSEKGCCPKCGKGWKRMVEKITIRRERPNAFCSYRDINGQPDQTKAGTDVKTLGWSPACDCKIDVLLPHGKGNIYDPIPCTVLDPFAGSGTTGQVARNLGRNFILIELNEKYIEMQEKRCGDLFCKPEIMDNR